MDNPYQFTDEQLKNRDLSRTRNDGPEGLGGWLILVAIGLIATPIRCAYFILTVYLPIFTEGVWDLLTDPNSPQYHEMWGPLLLFEIIGNVIVMCTAIAALVLYFRKSPIFPKLMIAYIGGNAVFVILDAVGGSLIPAMGVEESVMPEIIRSLIACAIWIPYMLVSKRVKNTFRIRQPATFADY